MIFLRAKTKLANQNEQNGPLTKKANKKPYRLTNDLYTLARPQSYGSIYKDLVRRGLHDISCIMGNMVKMAGNSKVNITNIN